MSEHISKSLREFVAQRAHHCCEYCLVHEDDMHFNFQIEHIVSLKHDGTSDPDNLAYSCTACNINKGTDLGTYLHGSRRLTRLYHPRFDNWKKHFEIKEGEIISKTRIGEATIKVLKLNHPDRLILRKVLFDMGRYPFII